MPSSKLLVDSSFLYTLFDGEDEKHEDAVSVADVYGGQFVIPYVVLTEVAYLFNRNGGIPAVLRFLDRLVRMQPHFEVLLTTDFLRVRAIMALYKDSKLDFVDCCIMALSERLNITQVCTFDHRDFNIFRPQHVSHLEILP
ncbi:MAG: PIN domain-containing protein [Anaerolineae bacterium]|nr:PIN domain-containing protein [Anaerolineae bacterium]